MQVATREDFGYAMSEVRAYFRPYLDPLIESSAQKIIRILFHLPVLHPQIGVNYIGAFAHPPFITFGDGLYAHRSRRRSHLQDDLDNACGKRGTRTTFHKKDKT